MNRKRHRRDDAWTQADIAARKIVDHSTELDHTATISRFLATASELMIELLSRFIEQELVLFCCKRTEIAKGVDPGDIWLIDPCVDHLSQKIHFLLLNSPFCLWMKVSFKVKHKRDCAMEMDQ